MSLSDPFLYLGLIELTFANPLLAPRIMNFQLRRRLSSLPSSSSSRGSHSLLSAHLLSATPPTHLRSISVIFVLLVNLLHLLPRSEPLDVMSVSQMQPLLSQIQSYILAAATFSHSYRSSLRSLHAPCSYFLSFFLCLLRVQFLLTLVVSKIQLPASPHRSFYSSFFGSSSRPFPIVSDLHPSPSIQLSPAHMPFLVLSSPQQFSNTIEPPRSNDLLS